MPRRSKRAPYVKIKINVDAVIMALVDRQINDPVYNKPRYAERSTLINNLLIRWLEEQGIRTSSQQIGETL